MTAPPNLPPEADALLTVVAAGDLDAIAVLADFLEERGDPRGPAVRQQTRPTPPVCYHCRRPLRPAAVPTYLRHVCPDCSDRPPDLAPLLRRWRTLDLFVAAGRMRWPAPEAPPFACREMFAHEASGGMERWPWEWQGFRKVTWRQERVAVFADPSALRVTMPEAGPVQPSHFDTVEFTWRTWAFPVPSRRHQPVTLAVGVDVDRQRVLWFSTPPWEKEGL